jgi:hypothetical protein
MIATQISGHNSDSGRKEQLKLVGAADYKPEVGSKGTVITQHKYWSGSKGNQLG